MTHPRISKGSRLYRCADCGRKQYMHRGEVNRRIRTRCTGCGGTFWEPHSDGAKENDVNAGVARGVVADCEKAGITPIPKHMQEKQ